MQRETSDEIEAAAARWAARFDRAPLSADDEERFVRWKAGDSRRLGAFMRLRAVALYSERAQALGPGFDPETFDLGTCGRGDHVPERSLSRRQLMWLGGSAIAACAVGTVAMERVLRDKTYSTHLGEVRVVTLEDGSVITLNTSSAIRVRFETDRRVVVLDEGEALFDVAKDRARPFIVEAGATAVRAVGTSFAVKRLAAAPVEVLVREGVVEVTSPAATQPTRLNANMRMVATGHGNRARPTSVAAEAVVRETAWQEGRIAFEGETLDNAAKVFERYSDTRIIIEDPSIGNEEITGLFAANDPVSFARAAAASLDLKATVGPGEVRLAR